MIYVSTVGLLVTHHQNYRVLDDKRTCSTVTDVCIEGPTVIVVTSWWLEN